MPVRFLQPEMEVWLFLLPALVLGWLAYVGGRHRFRRMAGLGSMVRALSDMRTLRSDLLTLLLIVIAVTALVLAIMRPHISVELMVPRYEKQDLIILLDRSVSMYAEDVLPSRFDRAIDEIRAMLSEKPEDIDRVGLVGFAGTSITLSWLTRDLETLFFFLDWIREDPGIYYGTDLTGALSAARDLASRDGQGTRTSFLVVSDGDDQSTDLPGLLGELKEAGIRVYTVGVGTAEAVPIPLERGVIDPMYLQDEQGETLQTVLNESTLRQVAQSTTGRFFRATSGRELAENLHRILLENRLQIGWDRLDESRDIHLPLLLLSLISTLILLLRWQT